MYAYTVCCTASNFIFVQTQSLEFFTGRIDQEQIIEESDTRTEPGREEDLGREREEEIEGREEDEGQEVGDISALLEQQVLNR